MRPEQAADALRKVHSSLMGDMDTVLKPATTIAFKAAKTAAAGRPTPQAPNLAASWNVTYSRNVGTIDTGSSIVFSGHNVYAGDVQGGILFGSNRSKQFHRPHRVPSWAWEAMEKALASAQLEDVLQAALDKATR